MTDSDAGAHAGTPVPARDRRSTVLVVLALAVPVVAAAVLVLTSGWVPASDRALIELRAHDVGTAHSPLVGPFSRLGWNHPGPLLFWILAVPYRLTGGSSSGVLLGVLAVNAAAVAGCLVIARRLGGRSLLVLTGLVVAVLVQGTGAAFLVDSWNPAVPVLPLLFLILATWAVVEGVIEVLPAAVVASCLAWQSHLGNAPVAGFLLAVAVGAFAIEAWRPRRGRPPGRRLVVGLATVVVAAGCVAPIALDVVRNDPSNAEKVLDAFRSPDPPPAGAGRALEVAARHVGPRGVWWTGDEPVVPFSGEVEGASPWGLLVPVAAVGLAAALGLRTRRRRELRLLGLTAATAVVATLAVSRTTGVLLPYLFNGMRAVSAALWLAIGWTLVRSVVALLPAPGRAQVRRLATPGAIVVVGVTFAVGLASLWRGVGLHLPDEHLVPALDTLEEPMLVAVGDASVFVHPTGAGCAVDVAGGLVLQLVEHGNVVTVPDAFASGSGRPPGARPPDVSLLVLCGPDARAGLRDGSRVVAAHGALDPAEQAELDALQEGFRSRLRAAGREDLLPMVEGGQLALWGPGLPGLGLDAGELRRFGELMQAQAFAVTLVREEPPPGSWTGAGPPPGGGPSVTEVPGPPGGL